MRMPSTLSAAAALALLAACSSPSSGPTAPTAVTITGTLKVHDASGGTGPFHLTDLQRFQIDSTYQGVPGQHALRVDVVDPSGLTYAQLRSEVAAADGSGAASQELEVRGAPIQMYHLVGSWRFVLAVDGAPLASAAVDVVD